MKWDSDPHPPVKKSPPPITSVFNAPYPVLKLKTPFNWRQKKHESMTLIHKRLNEHAVFHLEWYTIFTIL